MINENKETQLSLQALRSQDRKEFARMVELYDQLIYRLALRMLGNEQDAEDVLQETFIKAYRHLPNFDGRSNVSTWLYRIAVNEALMLLRKRKDGIISLDEPDDKVYDEQEPLEITDWCCLPEDTLMSTEARAVLEKAVDNLPPSLKIVFLLRDIQGLNTRETGEALNLSEVAVKTRLSRARLQLREQLSSYFGPKVIGNKGVQTR